MNQLSQLFDPINPTLAASATEGESDSHDTTTFEPCSTSIERSEWIPCYVPFAPPVACWQGCWNSGNAELKEEAVSGCGRGGLVHAVAVHDESEPRGAVEADEPVLAVVGEDRCLALVGR